MTLKILLAAVGIALLLSASPIQAQTTGGSFDSLSPGGQKIANALFSAQSTTGTPLTRDQIADLKKTEGWGKVFKQMKADGLVQAKNLGQVVSSYEQQQHATRSTATGASMRTATSGTSRRSTTAVTTTIGRGHARMTRASSRMHAGGRSLAMSRHAAGGFAHAGGGFGHGGMGGGFGGGFGHGGMGGGFGGGGHGGGHGR